VELYHPDNRNFADRGCDLEGFFELLKTLTSAVWGDNWGLLCDDEPTHADPENIKPPIIAYDVIRREPNKDFSPNGPRHVLKYTNPDRPGEIIEHWKQRFDCIVRFEIWANTNKECRMWGRRFEELMLTYTGFFKQMGIQFVSFRGDGIDATSSPRRQGLVSKVLRYYILEEHTIVVHQKATDEVIEKVKLLINRA